jgi:hypothetical protein
MLDEIYTVKWRPANARMKNKRLNGVQQIFEGKSLVKWLSAIFFGDSQLCDADFLCDLRLLRADLGGGMAMEEKNIGNACSAKGYSPYLLVFVLILFIH